MKNRIIKIFLFLVLSALITFGSYQSAKAWNGIATLKPYTEGRSVCGSPKSNNITPFSKSGKLDSALIQAPGQGHTCAQSAIFAVIDIMAISDIFQKYFMIRSFYLE